MLIVEFTGRAFSGKTTIRNAVMRELHQRQVSCRKYCVLMKSGRITRRIPFRAQPRNIFLFARCAWIALWLMPVSKGALREVMRRLFNKGRQYRDAEREKETVYLLDHGLFQNLRRIGRLVQCKNIHSIMSIVLRHLRPPDFLVIVHASKYTIEVRRGIRPNAHVAETKRPEMHEEPESVKQLTSAIHDLRDRNLLPVVMDVSNEYDTDVESVAREVADEIFRLLLQTRAKTRQSSSDEEIYGCP